MSRRLVLVTDIPAPYRIHLFNELHRRLAAEGIGFEVLFMARTVPIRFWPFNESSCKFPFRIVPGLHPSYGGNVFHFNPGILWSILRTPPTWLMVGGAWNMPTVMWLLLQARLGLWRTRTFMWAEANHKSMTYKHGFIAKLRSLIVRGAAGYAIPGQVAEYTIREYWGVRAEKFLSLPNLVNELAFRDQVRQLRSRKNELRRERGFSADDLVLLWPARLHESTKGIINFLSEAGRLLPQSARILIAGEGPDRARIESWLAGSSVTAVSLLGQQTEAQMLELLALADVLLLPSLRDPNPLSVIEGLWAGLPLFISNNCGNWPEAVDEGRNGWVVEPAEPGSIRSRFSELLASSRAELEQCGRVSLEIAMQRFSTARCMDRFVTDLLCHS